MPPIVNPYLKKKPAAAGGQARPAGSTSRQVPAKNNAVRKPKPMAKKAGTASQRPVGNATNAAVRSSRPEAGGTAAARPDPATTSRPKVTSNKNKGGFPVAKHHQQRHTITQNMAARPQQPQQQRRPQQPGQRAVRQKSKVPAAKTSAHQAQKHPGSLKQQLKRQIADLKRAKILRAQEKQVAEHKRQLEEKRRAEEVKLAEIKKKQYAERLAKQKQDAERLAKLQREAESKGIVLSAASASSIKVVEKPKKERKQRDGSAKLLADARRYEFQVRGEVAQVMARLVSDIESQNGEGRQQQQHAEETAPPAPMMVPPPFSPGGYGYGPMMPYSPNSFSPPIHPIGYLMQQHAQQQAYEYHSSVSEAANILADGKVHPHSWSFSDGKEETDGSKSSTVSNPKNATADAVKSVGTTPSAPAPSKKVTPSPFVQGGGAPAVAASASPKKQSEAVLGKVLLFASPTPSSTNHQPPGTKISPSQLESPSKQGVIVDNILKEMEEEEANQISPKINSIAISPIKIEDGNEHKLCAYEPKEMEERASHMTPTADASLQGTTPVDLGFPKLPSNSPRAPRTNPQSGAMPLYGAYPHAYQYPHPYPAYPSHPLYQWHGYPHNGHPLLPPESNDGASDGKSTSASVNPYADWVASAGKVKSPVKLPPYPTVTPKPQAPPPSTTTPRKKNTDPPILHERPLDFPSPFAVNYEIVESPIVITKDIGGSFGIDLKHYSPSVLVDPPPSKPKAQSTATPLSGPYSNINGQTQAVASAATSAQKSPKQRSRRVVFAAMIVVKADKQNARKDAAKKGSDIVRPRDMILAIDGHSTGGISFQQACALFAMAKTPAKGDETKVVQCIVTVARPKVVPPSFMAGPQASFGSSFSSSITKPSTIPFLLAQSGHVLSGEFSDGELKALLDGFKTIRKYGDLIIPLPKNNASLDFTKALLSHPTTSVALSRRDFNALAMKLSSAKASLDAKMRAQAGQHWRKQWKEECERASKNNIEDQAALGFELMTDARRSALRLMPRPGQGCKCGGTDHQYADDERCVLYRDIVSHVAPGKLEAFKSSRQEMRSKKSRADYDSAIITALQERQKKVQEQQEAEGQEAMFVELMEKVQVRKLKKAIFAPGLLSVAIISGVASLMDKQSMEEVANISDDDESDDDDDDDDDLPLNALTSSAPPAKKRKVEPTQPNFHSIAELLLHISKTWGHLLKENETNAEYAWHLKLSGLNFGEAVDQYKRNPRQPESLSFENIQFLLDSAMMSRLSKPASTAKGSEATDPSVTIPKNVETKATSVVAPAQAASNTIISNMPAADQVRSDELDVALLASQEGTGLWDEVQALIKSEVLHVRSDGVIVLKSGWQDNVGASILLDGQERGWFKGEDPGNTFCLHDDVRSLTDYWERRGRGWALSDSSPDDEAEFIDDEYHSIKREFIQEYDSHFDSIDGVGKFGLASN